jgi:hypothetical protein
MAVSKRAWNVAWRDKPDHVPLANPFAKMDLAYTGKPTRPVSYVELIRFVTAADAAGEGSIGTAAMIAYFWLQRQEDIVSRLTWGHYRWPEIMERLDKALKFGTLIVTRDRLDRRRKVHLPWKLDHFRHRVAAIRQAAGIDPEVKFMGLGTAETSRVLKQA